MKLLGDYPIRRRAVNARAENETLVDGHLELTKVLRKEEKFIWASCAWKESLTGRSR